MSAEKPTNKVYPKDTEGAGSETGKNEQQSSEVRGTSDVVQFEHIPEALRKLALEVNEKCAQLFEDIVRNQLLIFHPHRDVSRAIKGVVDDACSEARDEVSFRRCIMASQVMLSVLLGQSPKNEPICYLIRRLLKEEYHGEATEQIKAELEGIVNATVYRLNISPEKKNEIERYVIEHITEGKLYIDVVFERIKSLLVRRLKPLEFRNYVAGGELDEMNNKLTIHVILPRTGEPPDTENVESFTIVSDLKKVGTAYLEDTDVVAYVTDLSRPESIVLRTTSKKEEPPIGNFAVTIPYILLPAIERFLRMGWIPDGTSTEFLDAIRDKIKVIKTPEEVFRDTLAKVFYALRWGIVAKTSTGEYVLETEIPISADNPWQGYAYEVSSDKEIWIPNPLWQKIREAFEKAKVPRNLVEYIVKDKHGTRYVKTCDLGRSIRMTNLVILSIERILEILGDEEIENYIVHKEPPCGGESE